MSQQRSRPQTKYSSTRGRTNLVDYDLGVVEEGEKAVVRVGKDMTTAGATGAIHALHEFLRKFKWF